MRRMNIVMGSILLLVSGTVYVQRTCLVKTIADCPETGCRGWDQEFDQKRNLTAHTWKRVL